MITLRPFTREEYPALVAVMNAASPEFPRSVEDLHFRDNCREAKCRHARWVAVDADNGVVGVGEYDQRADQYDPQRFVMNVQVRPEWQNQRIGSALYEQVIADLLPLGPHTVRAFAREDHVCGVRFLTDRGHVESMRDGGARLDLSTFDPARPAEAEERAATTAGITIRTLAELKTDPDRDRKLHTLFEEIMVDVPPLGERTPVLFDTFVRTRLDRPDLLPDAYFIAVAPSGEYVGVSALNRPPDGSLDHLSTGVTGVRRPWRRNGLALVLKRRGLVYAKSQPGCRYVATWNASHNAPILALNARLGFVRAPWRIHLVRTFAREAA